MMDDLYNNVYVFHKGREISIAQHWDSPSDKLEYRDAYGALSVSYTHLTLPTTPYV